MTVARGRRFARWTAAAVGLAAATYGAYVAVAWFRYGQAVPPTRAKFRRYWSLASPGIILTRRLMLRPVKPEAETQARALH